MAKPSRTKLQEMLAAALEAYGPAGHPAFRLLELINDRETPRALVIEACSKLMPYLAPKLQTMEISGPDGAQLQGPVYVDQLQVVQLLYDAQTNPQKRTELLRALDALPAPVAE